MIRIIAYIIILSLLGIAAFFILLNYLIHRIFFHKPVLQRVDPGEAGLRVEEHFIRTRHEKKVQLMEVTPSPATTPIILCVHGWANTAEKLFPIARKLSKNYPVFLLNTRNHGKSDEDSSMNIIKYEEDILHAVVFITKHKQPSRPLVVIGHSLGAASALLAAHDDERIDGVVSISSFADLSEILKQGFMRHKLPGWFVNSLITYLEFRAGRSLQELSPSHTLKKIKRPVLLIHGTKDEVIPFTDLERLVKQAKHENVEKLIARGHSHSSLLEDENIINGIDFFIRNNFAAS